MKPVTAPAAKTLSLLNTISKYEKHLRGRILTGKMQLCLERRIRNIKTEEFCLGQAVFFWTARKLKSDKRWQGPGIIIARYGDTYALVHFRGAYLEVSLDDMKSTDRILDVLGCDGTLQLHLANTKFPLHYLVDSQTLIFLSKARNEILKRNNITWANTDTRLSVRDFYEDDLNQQIAIDELGGGTSF